MTSTEQTLPKESEWSSTEELSRLRVVINRLARRLRPTSAAGSLTSSEIEVLTTVGNRGPLRLSELASLAGFNPTMLSRIVARLEEMRLLRRLADVSDKRASLVSLTATGRALQERVRTERTRVLARELGEMSKAEREAVLSALPALELLAERLLEHGQGAEIRAERRTTSRTRNRTTR